MKLFPTFQAFRSASRPARIAGFFVAAFFLGQAGWLVTLMVEGVLR